MSDEERQDVISTETWKGEGGVVLLNYLQQHDEGFDFAAVVTPLEEAETTDIWGVVS